MKKKITSGSSRPDRHHRTTRTKKVRVRDFIGGKHISRQSVLRDLGDPKKWSRYKARIEAEFRQKPPPKDKGEPLELL